MCTLLNEKTGLGGSLLRDCNIDNDFITIGNTVHGTSNKGPSEKRIQ